MSNQRTIVKTEVSLYEYKTDTIAIANLIKEGEMRATKLIMIYNIIKKLNILFILFKRPISMYYDFDNRLYFSK